MFVDFKGDFKQVRLTGLAAPIILSIENLKEVWWKTVLGPDSECIA